MRRGLLLAIAAIFVICASGCYPKTRQVTVPVEVGQNYQLSIVEGKTTKQQVIDVLGLPETIGGSLNYRFYKKDTCKLSLTQKDGTVLNLILGRQPGCKYDSMTVWLDNGVVSSVSLR